MGGTKATGERYAAMFANAGMVSLCFTYAGWDASGSRALIVGDEPKLEGSKQALAKVQFVREVVDPIEWLQNYRSAIDYIEGELNVDGSRIGAWGTSFGGGIAMHTAANDARIKVLAVQVPALSMLTEAALLHAKQRAIDIARGDVAPVPQRIDAFPRLAGTPHLARFLQFKTLDELGKLKVPTLILDAGNEDLFDIKENGGRAYEILKVAGKSPVAYKVIEGIDHYGIYFDGYEEASQAALDWFKRYL